MPIYGYEDYGETFSRYGISIPGITVPTVSPAPSTPTPVFNAPTGLSDYSPEYNRIKNQGDSRSFDQWLFDHVTETNDPNPAARSYLGLTPPELPSTPKIPSFVEQFFTDPVTPVNSNPIVPGNYGVTDPIPTYNPPQGTIDQSGLLSEISNLFNSLLGNASRPNISTTIAPVSETYVDNRLSLVDNSVTGFSATEVTSLLDRTLMRITDLLSVPRGGDEMLPNLVPAGYARNFEQSQQRQGVQTVASVSGLSSLLGSAPAQRASRIQIFLGLAAIALTLYLYFKLKRR